MLALALESLPNKLVEIIQNKKEKATYQRETGDEITRCKIMYESSFSFLLLL